MTSQIPLFPLETVLLPEMVLPMRIFEPRYVAMLRDLQAERRIQGGHGPLEFGIIALRSGFSRADDWPRAEAGVPDVYPIGCMAQIHQLKKVEDLYQMKVSGGRRFEVRSFQTDKTYLRAEVSDLIDAADPDPEGTDRAATDSLRLFNEYTKQVQTRLGAQISIEAETIPTDPKDLSWLIAAAIRLPRSERQALLSTHSDADRLALQVALLRREVACLQVWPSLQVGAEHFAAPSRN